ncbi:MAG: arylsulfatase [Verrucomicrobia bacterium]|nr:arylsulfatase [Verrucomicrobiota bacterium]
MRILPKLWWNTVFTWALWSLLLPQFDGAASLEPERPNIVIVMADDMGFSDIGCYGGEIQTPNLDRLAAHGVRFTQFYNTSRCCPTRASLITGLYPHQAGVGHMMEDRGLESYRGDLNRKSLTIAEVLKQGGYATFMSGKWHVTRYIAPEGPKHNWPLERGFDRFFGTIHGAGSFYDPNSLTDGNTQVPPGEGFYYTDAIADHAATYIRDHGERKTKQPFFLYVAFTAPHWPMHAKPADMDQYKGRYDSGWDVLREERRERMVKLGVINPRWPLSPRDPRSPAWEDAPLKEWESRLMEVYAAMIDSMDQGIGRIVQALTESGQWDNTLLLFLADNGGCAEGMGRGREFEARPDRPVRPMAATELQKKMIPEFTRDGYPVRRGRGVMAGPADTYLGYGVSWANASNTPFREYKHWVHEGGISSPLIVHWPRGIDREKHGRLESQPAHLIDLMATCVDVSGADYPREFNGQTIHPMEGVSLRPAFSGRSVARREPIFWEHEGNRAVRDGRWKLVAKEAAGPWELYDIEEDRSELIDRARELPDVTKRLVSLWEAWAVRVGVLPWIWKPAYERSR